MLYNLIFQVAIALLALFAVAQGGVVAPVAPLAAATYISRAPAFDTAVIKSDRIGGNFAYSVAENHAYAQHTPIVQTVSTPVAVSYTAAAPVAYAAAAPVAYASYPYAAAPAFY